jgi:hypothetical protein
VTLKTDKMYSKMHVTSNNNLYYGNIIVYNNKKEEEFCSSIHSKIYYLVIFVITCMCSNLFGLVLLYGIDLL